MRLRDILSLRLRANDLLRGGRAVATRALILLENASKSSTLVPMITDLLVIGSLVRLGPHYV